MSKLLEMKKYFETKLKAGKTNYAVPKRWMPDNYIGSVKLSGRKFFVNPYEYFYTIINAITAKTTPNTDYSKSLSLIKNDASTSWIKESVIYSAHVRMTSAYIHSENERFIPIDENGYKESGTFLKMIALIPYLRKYNVDCIYLLPVTQSSSEFKKGEVGSPYSAKDFFKIEHDYHDLLLADKFTADDEFGAFVEACHMTGIRVMLDFVPRTSSRDNNLILEHPDWFYWIDVKELSTYNPPFIDTLDFEQPSVNNLHVLYNHPETKKHLAKFRFDPKTQNPEKWEKFVKKNKNNPDFLEEIIKEFELITVPGFSDWINDPQPTWDDVTFTRLYMSHPQAAEQFINENQPPYVLFDVVKSSNFPGTVKNMELWNKIADIMPFYQRNFGIDGARLDMGHALPKELEHMIIERSKQVDPAFVIIAEELSMDNHEKAKNSGYDGILGNSWWTEPRLKKDYWLKRFVSDIMPKIAVPAFATAETPDSPRAVTREGGETFAKMMAVINTFMPNGITVINSGSEIFEAQPMNTGLDFEKPQEQKFENLKPTDQFYGKLAFFDWYALHWDTDHHMVKLLELLGGAKERVKDVINDVQYYRYMDFGENGFVMFWWNGNKQKGVIVPVNLDFTNPFYFDIDLGFVTWKPNHKIETVIENYRRGESHWDVYDGRLKVNLNPGEARVYFVE